MVRLHLAAPACSQPGSSWEEPGNFLFDALRFGEDLLALSAPAVPTFAPSSRDGSTPTPTCPAGQGGQRKRMWLQQALEATKRLLQRRPSLAEGFLLVDPVCVANRSSGVRGPDIPARRRFK